MMNIINQVVPPTGIRYISEWEGYEMPTKHCIVDKGVTGCGYTEYCLRNDKNVILCSPRKLLLKNKADQHENDLNILYFENCIIKFDIESGEDNQDENEEIKTVTGWRERIRNHINYCWNPFDPKPAKILVTYDSLKHIIQIFKDLGIDLGSFYFVVDEFQSIFLDSFFKADVEFSFVEYLQECENVLYLSATPMLDEYLEQVDEFKNLPYYKIDWSQTSSVETIRITRKRITSISGACSDIIQNFKAGNFPIALDSNGVPVQSREAVFYMNSIADIQRSIRKSGISPEEVNIICSDTKTNQDKLKVFSGSLGYKGDKGFKVGHVPVPEKGETNKPFTFCTKTAYVGADFRSLCASTYVFADPNIKCLALDISLDLPQIVGRQRDRENPFKNQVTFFYINLREVKDYELFKQTQEERRASTKNLLEGFNNLTPAQQKDYLRKLRSDIKVSQYSGDFVSISSKTGLPIHNKFIELADERAWKVSQEDYQNTINVTKAIQDQNYQLQEDHTRENMIVESFILSFESVSFFHERMKMYCEFMDLYQEVPYIVISVQKLMTCFDYQRFYDYYGTKGCSARKYQKGELESGMISDLKLSQSNEGIISLFQVGEKYTKAEIKLILKLFYESNGIKRTAKANDLEEYFELSRVKIKNSQTGKYDEGYKIISRK